MAHNHKIDSDRLGPVNISLVTVSDTRTQDDDTSGAYLKECIKISEHSLHSFKIIKDELDLIDSTVSDLVNSDTNIIIFCGGTGVSKRDVTFDIVSERLEKTLIGFGEIFRMLSYEQIGSAAIMSRAVAGIIKEKVIISIPGSKKAVQLAWEKLIAPEIKHLAWEITR